MTGDEYGEQVITLTLDELSTRVSNAYMLWLLYGRGVEGMPEDEMIAAMNRLPHARWISIFCYDIQQAVRILHLGLLDPDVRPNPYEAPKDEPGANSE